MKSILPLVLISSLNLSAQFNPPVYEKMSNGFRNVSFANNGELYSSPSGIPEYLTINKDTILSLGFSKGLWLGGERQDGSIAFAGNEYGRSDFVPGPIDRTTGDQYQDEIAGFFDRHWNFSRIGIMKHKKRFNNGSLNPSNIQEDILSYPAKGNQFYKNNFDLDIDHDLAPFYDHDLDGVYNPFKGDFPSMTSKDQDFLPTFFSYCVYSDTSGFGLTYSNQAGFEVQQFTFINDCNEHIQDNYTYYTRLIVNYLGEDTLDNFIMTIWEDNDLGCFENDFMGCDSTLNLSYTYNNFSWLDENACQSHNKPEVGIPLSSNYESIKSTLFLSHKMFSYINYISGIGDGPLYNISPAVADQYYLYMSGKFLDGTSMVNAKNGYDNGEEGTRPTHFLFHDLPTDSTGWSMYALNYPFVVYNTMSSTHMGSLLPNASIVFDFAETIILSTPNPGPSIFNELEAVHDHVHLSYAGFIDDMGECGKILLSENEIMEAQDELMIYPNPSTGVVRFEGALPVTLEAYNTQGMRIKSIRPSNNAIREVDLSYLPSGIYYLKLFDKVGNHFTKPLILMK